MTNKEIGRYCKQLRQNAGLTQEALGDMFGLSKSRINSLEHGKVSIREYEIKSYSQLFDAPMSQFNSGSHKQAVKERRYLLSESIKKLKNELGIDYLPAKDISNKTGINKKRLSNITSRTDCGATEEEVKLLAGYFGKEKEFFMGNFKTVTLVTKKYEDVSTPEKNKEEPAMVSNIKEVEAKPVNKVEASEPNDIWRDKAHELHRQLGEARREIERLKNEGAPAVDNSELEELRDNNKELGRRIENLAIENANLVEENDNLLKDYEASQNDNKELTSRIEEIAKERDNYREKYDTIEVAFDALEKENSDLKAEHNKLVDAKARVVNANAELKAQCNNYKEIIDSLLSEDNDDLQARYDALKAECDKYKDTIVKVVIKAAELMLEKS